MNIEPQDPQDPQGASQTPPPSGSHVIPTPGAASAPGAPSTSGEPSLTPPPADAGVPPTAPVAPVATERGSTGKSIAIITAVIGGVALLGAGITAAVVVGNELSSQGSDGSQEVQAVGVNGIDSIDLEVGASGVRVEFADVDQAELNVQGARGGSWTLERDEEELVVRSPDGRFGWWFGGWFDDDSSAVLTLPEELRSAGLDADFTIDAGSLDIEGDFGEVDIQVGAGAMFIEGSATSVDADVSAGRAEIELADVREADFTISAGRLTGELTGSAPSEMTIDVSAGSLELTVPDVEYDVRQEVSAGSFDNRVSTSTNARNTVFVEVSAGSATLRAGD